MMQRDAAASRPCKEQWQGYASNGEAAEPAAVIIDSNCQVK